MKNENKILPSEPDKTEYRIFVVRGVRVMLDSDLAKLYEVETRTLNQSVKRNRNRFPEDFMFRLSDLEVDELVSQNVIPSKQVLGGYSPNVFTEHGVSMLSAILRSKRAVTMSIFIVRAFVKLREVVSTNNELALKISEIELLQEKQGQKISQINEIVIQLIGERSEPKKIAGFCNRRPKSR